MKGSAVRIRASAPRRYAEIPAEAGFCLPLRQRASGKGNGTGNRPPRHVRSGIGLAVRTGVTRTTPGANRHQRRRVSIGVRFVVIAAAVLVAALVGVAAGITWLDDDEAAESAGVLLEGNEPGVRGVGFFEQDGERLTGFVAVWGLEPNSEHSVHFHGPDSSCGTEADAVAAHPDLKADRDGVAYTDVDLTAEPRLLRGGFYYNVHEGPSRVADNPEIACGDIGPDARSSALH